MGAAAGDDGGTVPVAEGQDGADLPDRFERDEVCRRVGIDSDRLYDWAGARRSKGPAIVPPSRTPYSGSGRGRGPVFSWEDVVTLRAVKQLHQAGAPTQLIRKAFVKLRQRGLTALQVGLLVEDKAIFMIDVDPDTGTSRREALASRTRTIVTPGQGVLILASEESDKLRAEVRSLPAGQEQRHAAVPAPAVRQLELGSDQLEDQERRSG